MKQLELYYPVKPWDGGQPFGEKGALYTSLGILGHNGIDEPCPVGTRVSAPHNGRVIRSLFNPTAGNYVCILDESGKYETCYLHLSKPSCVPGQTVKVGDEIGRSGNTGSSTGPHLHFMLYECVNGERINLGNGYKGAINPKPFFNGKYAEDIFVSLQNRVVSLLKMLLALQKPK
jgi:murein DD-endopeptidase MepM/ murein hydrolase activator NlpD